MFSLISGLNCLNSQEPRNAHHAEGLVHPNFVKTATAFEYPRAESRFQKSKDKSVFPSTNFTNVLPALVPVSNLIM
jgi:hypothetical protein